MDHQIEAIIESNIALNQECLQELVTTSEEVQKDVHLIVMQTSVSINADAEWDGVSQTIKEGLGGVHDEDEADQKELEQENKALAA